MQCGNEEEQDADAEHDPTVQVLRPAQRQVDVDGRAEETHEEAWDRMVSELVLRASEAAVAYHRPKPVANDAAVRTERYHAHDQRHTPPARSTQGR